MQSKDKERYCDEIDCAWCADPNCPHDKKMSLVNLDALQKLVEKTDKKNEKEFNKLQKKLDITIQQYNKVVEQNKNLQKENGKLREKIESYNCNANCYKYKEANNYKQALEKIREIAKSACDTSVCHYDCKNCSDGKIIDKINEVLQ